MTAARFLKRKGPEATGIAPDPVARNPREKDQNMTTNSIAAPKAAMEDIWGQTVALQHVLHFLTSDLESILSEQRGKVEGETVTLRFQRGGIAATLWLASEAWSKSVDLTAAIERIELAGERRAAS